MLEECQICFDTVEDDEEKTFSERFPFYTVCSSCNEYFPLNILYMKLRRLYDQCSNNDYFYYLLHEVDTRLKVLKKE